MADEIQNPAGAQGAPALPETIEESHAEIKKLRGENAELASGLNDARAIIDELKTQNKDLREQKVTEVKDPIVEIDGVKYKVVHGVHGIGDAKALSKDLDACKKIIAKGGAALVKI